MIKKLAAMRRKITAAKTIIASRSPLVNVKKPFIF